MPAGLAIVRDGQRPSPPTCVGSGFTVAERSSVPRTEAPSIGEFGSVQPRRRTFPAGILPSVHSMAAGASPSWLRWPPRPTPGHWQPLTQLWWRLVRCSRIHTSAHEHCRPAAEGPRRLQGPGWPGNRTTRWPGNRTTGWAGNRKASAAVFCSENGGARRRRCRFALFGSAHRPRSCLHRHGRSHPLRRR